MNRQEFLEGTLQEIKEHVAQGRATRLLVLLPEKMRNASIMSKSCDVDLELLDEGLKACEAVSVECLCCICQQTLPCDALDMPEDHRCFNSKSQILKRLLAKLVDKFDPFDYDHGDITRLVVARHAQACQMQAEKRRKVRETISANRRLELRAMLRAASRKKTLRIERLRDSMGQEAFSEMVESQLWQRRHRAYGDEGSRLWDQAEDWWYSDEATAYREGPPEPQQELVKDVLLPQQSLLHPWRFLRPPQDPGANLARVDVELRVSRQTLPKLLLKAMDRILAHQLPDLPFKCFMQASVDFCRDEGERVPSVHITSKRGRPDELVLLDAASLDNLRPGDIVVPRRILEVNGRVLGTVGWEDVALALPRPYDMFDAQLRGPNIQSSSKLAVAWDLTNCLATAQIQVVWPGSPHVLVVNLQGSSEDCMTSEDATNRLIAELDRHRRMSCQYLRHLRLRAQAWEQRKAAVTRCLLAVARPCQQLLGAIWRSCRRLGIMLKDRVWDPCLHGLRAFASMANRAWSLAEPARRWCHDLLEYLGACSARVCSHSLQWLWSSASELASSIWEMVQRCSRVLGQRLPTCTLQLHEGHLESLSRWWASRPWPRRAVVAAAEAASRRLSEAGLVMQRWWSSRPWPRRAARSAADRAGPILELAHRWTLQPLARAFSGCFAAVSSAFRKACIRLFPPRRSVRLARVRRHDERHGLD
ncbi:unnamed protein product [Symbiodinium pilosum]|uniref:Uncharacterized protein n=1 Tax=Symbiodinium pilosum TaxID=2952 RepID=A0A812YHT4_SYMPI|nr:unnamed protein product [Symbiodinium pilosum]